MLVVQTIRSCGINFFFFNNYVPQEQTWTAEAILPYSPLCLLHCVRELSVSLPKGENPLVSSQLANAGIVGASGRLQQLPLASP